MRKKNSKKRFIAAVATVIGLASVGQAEARDRMNIVGSSTVYPFASYVSEEFGQTTRYKTPVIESTGSGGGMKLFCAGNGMDTPDITNASRRMKAKELKICAKNGVTDITEVVIGYDGIVIAQSKSNPALNLTRKDMLLAVAAEVPNKAGTKLIPNPFHHWDEINPDLPHRPIRFYGPPTSSGTRDAFADLVMRSQSKKMAVYTDLYKSDKKKYKGYKKYKVIRQDGVYVPSGENDNLIVQKLIKDKDAFGIFGYSFLEENSDRISGATVEGVNAGPETISSGNYPVSRSLYFYIKNSHTTQVAGMKNYIDLFLSEDMVGEGGNLAEIGLIPQPKADRDRIRSRFLKKTRLTAADF